MKALSIARSRFSREMKFAEVWKSSTRARIFFGGRESSASGGWDDVDAGEGVDAVDVGAHAAVVDSALRARPECRIELRRSELDMMAR